MIYRMIGFFTLIVFGFAQQLMACPACKDSFTASGQNASVGDAYSWSIMFMLGVPMTILTVFTVVITRKIRQNPNSTTSV